MVKWGETTELQLVGRKTGVNEALEVQQSTEMEAKEAREQLNEELHEKKLDALVSFRDFEEVE